MIKKTDKDSTKLDRLYKELEYLLMLEQATFNEADILRGQLNPVDAAELEEQARHYQKKKDAVMKKIEKIERAKGGH